MQPGMSASLVARRRAGIAPSQLVAWKRRMLEGGFRAVQADEDVAATGRVRELEKRVHALERLLGRKTMEVEAPTEALDAARPKKADVAARVVERSGGRLPMGLVAATLEVSRSNLVERSRRPSKPRGPYAKAGDAALLVLIRETVDQRASYGYRRVTALVNRRPAAKGQARVNASASCGS